MLINFSDTNNFATKACYAILDGEERNVVKSPTEMDANGNITKSFKKSKQGKLKLVKNADGTYRTEPHYSGVMVHNLFPLSTTLCLRIVSRCPENFTRNSRTGPIVTGKQIGRAHV